MSALLEAAVNLDELTEEQLEERAFELQREAEQHRAVANGMFGEAAKCRARAERMRREEAEAAERRAKRGRKKPTLLYDPNDSLIAAAALATEDLAAGFDAGDLAAALHIGRERAFKLLLAVEAKGFVARSDDKWRSVDPDETRVRDKARELGTFTAEQLADAVEMTVTELSYYMDWLRDERMVVGAGPMYEYRKPGPELTITKVNDGRYTLPEKKPPAGTEILSPRGAPIYTQNHAARGRAGQNPQQRHKMHQRDERRKKMEKAREEAAEKQRAKAQRDPYAAKRGKAAAKRRARLIS